jgi:hypothetical protein
VIAPPIGSWGNGSVCSPKGTPLLFTIVTPKHARLPQKSVWNLYRFEEITGFFLQKVTAYLFAAAS